MINLRIHHFFDIVRDYGNGIKPAPHPFGHSYHKIAEAIFNNKVDKIRLVIQNDDVCLNCDKLIQDRCIDIIEHRADYDSKQMFNDDLDSRIMNVMGYRVGQVTNFIEILKRSGNYLDSIYEIYKGNDIAHTKLRKQNVSKGIDKKMIELGLE